MNLTKSLYTCLLVSFALGISIGCTGMEENTRKIEDLQHQLAEISEKSAKDKATLEDANQKLKVQNKKLVMLNKKIDRNKDNIEELKTTTLEVRAPTDLKVVKLADEPAATARPVVVKRPIKRALKRTAAPTPPKRLRVEKAKQVKKRPKVKIAPIAKSLKKQKPSSSLTEQARKARAKKPAPVKIKNTKQHYNLGLDLFYAGKYTESRKVFTQIIRDHPKHSLADNALYWMGETYYSEDAFDKALDQFHAVAKRYPKSNKAPDALLKAGYTYIVINKPAAAKKTFNDLLRLYPDAGVAKKARKQLQSMK